MLSQRNYEIKALEFIYALIAGPFTVLLAIVS
jgi:hypothetical protein